MHVPKLRSIIRDEENYTRTLPINSNFLYSIKMRAVTVSCLTFRLEKRREILGRKAAAVWFDSSCKERSTQTHRSYIRLAQV